MLTSWPGRCLTIASNPLTSRVLSRTRTSCNGPTLSPTQSERYCLRHSPLSQKKSPPSFSPIRLEVPSSRLQSSSSAEVRVLLKACPSVAVPVGVPSTVDLLNSPNYSTPWPTQFTVTPSESMSHAAIRIFYLLAILSFLLMNSSHVFNSTSLQGRGRGEWALLVILRSFYLALHHCATPTL